MWQREYSIDTSASREAIWRLFSDVRGWKAWNAGIQEISIAGPFAVGTEFTMQPPGQPSFVSKLVQVRENELFEDETIIDDIHVLVMHRIETLDSKMVRVTYAAKVSGPGEEEIGPAITGDFPDVLKALASSAEG